MPNIKSAKKRVLVADRNRQRNVSIKSSVKTAIKKVLEVADSGDVEKIKAALSNAYSTIDKAVSKGVIHRNNAARKKSRLTLKVNKTEG